VDHGLVTCRHLEDLPAFQEKMIVEFCSKLPQPAHA
jgi:hypothetical protein